MVFSPAVNEIPGGWKNVQSAETTVNATAPSTSTCQSAEFSQSCDELSTLQIKWCGPTLFMLDSNSSGSDDLQGDFTKLPRNYHSTVRSEGMRKWAHERHPRPWPDNRMIEECFKIPAIPFANFFEFN
jgi:hypothetical protein